MDTIPTYGVPENPWKSMAHGIHASPWDPWNPWIIESKTGLYGVHVKRLSSESVDVP